MANYSASANSQLTRELTSSIAKAILAISSLMNWRLPSLLHTVGINSAYLMVREGSFDRTGAVLASSKLRKKSFDVIKKLHKETHLKCTINWLVNFSSFS